MCWEYIWNYLHQFLNIRVNLYVYLKLWLIILIISEKIILQPMQINIKLPIHKYQAKILQTIDKEPVVIISGKTGCGKSTQVPQFILNKHQKSVIAVCEPRRLAATSLAVRVSAEQKCKLGTKVGYHIGMEVFSHQKTSICYMTYGILIQELLFRENMKYTHIILDEVHQRSLEMDFTFIALKQILKEKYKQQIKLIIMSATINSQLFSSYFCIHSNKIDTFFIPTIRIQEIQIEQNNRSFRRGTNNWQQKTKKSVIVSVASKQYRPCESIILPDENEFKIQEYFLNDIGVKSLLYKIGDQIRITDEMYETAVNLILKNIKCISEGDILIFVPGMIEIKNLKMLILKNSDIDENRVIEVHSAFSEELYWRLFDCNVKNKVIVATNMGQSSITLPNCKIVIDFCLNRKSFSNKMKGISRYETRLASKANLCQRAGRVGRVSDGLVYRLITKEQYNQIPEFDIPEIKCVGLQMVILKAKQLDLINKSNLFEDPYCMLLSAIEPPEINDIELALKNLIKEEALVELNSEKQQAESNGANLKLSKVGQFMVSMPCDLKISKMILFGLKLNIPQTIINISAVITLSKPFYAHEQKRYSIEQFLHALVGYDGGYYNDFLLRQKLFSHWKREYYLPFKEKKMFKNVHKRIQGLQISKNIQEQRNYHYQLEITHDDQYKIIEEFDQLKITENQQRWCMTRGVYPNSMREILKISQNIRIKIQQIGYVFQSNQDYISNQLVLLCLIYAFPDNQCEVVWQAADKGTKQLNFSENLNYVTISDCPETADNLLEDYLRPEIQYEIEYLKGYKNIYGNSKVLSKLLLPVHYNKANIQNASVTYKYLAKNKAYYAYTTNITHRRRPLIVLNESINKVNILRVNEQKKQLGGESCYLITNTIIESKQKKMISVCALVSDITFHLIQLITKNNVQLELHKSKEFISRIIIEKVSYDAPCFITNQEIEVIQQMRSLSKRSANNEVTCKEELITVDHVQTLIQLLTNAKPKPKKEVWQYLFQKQHSNLYPSSQDTQIFGVDSIPELKKHCQYYRRYFNWKKEVFKELYYFFRPYTIEKATILCKECLNEEIVQIEVLSSYDFKNQQLGLNQYSGSWVKNKQSNDIFCRKKHLIGKAFNEDFAELQHQKLTIYLPFRQHIPFQKIYTLQQIEELIAKEKQGICRLDQQKQKLQFFECKICFSINQHDEKYRATFEKQYLGYIQFWKKIFQHMRGKQHRENRDLFLSNINFYDEVKNKLVK